MRRAKPKKIATRAKARARGARSETPAPKHWTVMVWIAGDNNLEENGTKDIREMKRVGSNADVNIVAQFDSMTDNHARRYFIRKGTSTPADVVADLGPTNTGDPAVASEFFRWAVKNYPAQHYLAVVWNHGSGIDETDIYRGRSAVTATGRVPIAPHKTPRTRGGDALVPAGRIQRALGHGYSRSLFSTTLDTAMRSRAIAYDDTARDFLDNLELRRVLEEVRDEIGHKIDVVGFDACLMNVVELASELQDTADVIVGSEEVEPVDGWPYDAILKALAKKPTMDGRELSQIVVDEYVRSYTSDSVTQSALDLTRAGAVERAVDELAGSLIAAIANVAEYGAVARALNTAQRFDMPDFIDLFDLTDRLIANASDLQVRAKASAVQQALTGASPFVLAEKHAGAGVGRAHGVSIYFPRGQATLVYDRLGFARNTRWDDFIVAFTGQPIPTLPPGVRSAERRPKRREPAA